MRITKYNLELNSFGQTLLIKERATNYPGEKLDTPLSIAEMLNEVFSLYKQAEEYLYLLAINSKNKPIGVFEVSHGTVNVNIASTREIFIKALLIGAVGIILAHNHPSGDCTPSQPDVSTTNKIREAGKLIGIPVLDHIIVGNGYLSFEENGL